MAEGPPPRIKAAAVPRSMRIDGLASADPELRLRGLKRSDEHWPGESGGLRLRLSASGGVEFLSEFRAHSGGNQDTVIPIAAVDGRAQTVGFGEFHVPLVPGCHLITVQTQETKSVCCSSWPVRVEPGDEVAELEYAAPFIDPRRHEVLRGLHGILGLRGVPQVGGPVPGLRHGGWWTLGMVAALAAGIPLGMSATATSSSVLVFLAVVVPLVTFGGLAARYGVLNRAHRADLLTSARAWREQARTADPLEWDVAAGGQRLWCLPHGGGVLPTPANGLGLIVVRPRLRQRSEPFPMASFASTPPSQARSYTAPVEIELDRVRLPSGWATWVVEVAPGAHRIEVTGGEASETADVSVLAGRAAELLVDVEVTKTFTAADSSAEMVAEHYAVSLADGHGVRDAVNIQE